MINSKLSRMVQITNDWQNVVNDDIALSHFEFLYNENMHQSAYNLLYENFIYSDLNLNKDSLEQTLTKDSIPLDSISDRVIFITDNTK